MAARVVHAGGHLAEGVPFGHRPGFAGVQGQGCQFEDLFCLGAVRLHVVDDVVHCEPGRSGPRVGDLEFEGEVRRQRHGVPVQPGRGHRERRRSEPLEGEGARVGLLDQRAQSVADHPRRIGIRCCCPCCGRGHDFLRRVARQVIEVVRH